ncbi:MAG: hypothetical protein IKR18_10835, partial [Bacteroidaceae bacterium]|nr:hypothetical protein [Bacteroidaceae bacterium]
MSFNTPGTEVETEIDKAATEFVMDAAERNRKVGVNTYVLTEEQAEMELARIEEARENASPFSRKQKRALETASVSSLEEHHHAVIPSAQGAKILEKLDNLANNLEKLSRQRKGFLNDVAEALGARKHGSGSQYATFETKNGRTVTIRLVLNTNGIMSFNTRCNRAVHILAGILLAHLVHFLLPTLLRRFLLRNICISL